VAANIQHPDASSVNASPWITAEEAATYARCGVKLLYREIANGRLRAARLGGRRKVVTKRAYIDEWLERTAEPIEVRR
jgi:excisionase family DNA binding protein